jgi:hypothetical protein
MEKSISNFDRLMNSYKESFPNEIKSKIDIISDFVKNYIVKNGYNIKYLNSCSTGFAGVRTKNQIIICSPSNMRNVGDLIYTIFHEIRHDQQIRNIKMTNPLVDFDLNDFENLYDQYWEMELDADQFAKNMIGKLVVKLKIPIDLAKNYFSLSPYILNYPNMGSMIRSQITMIIQQIKQMKKMGVEYTDIQDHPIVKSHLHKLESFI